MATIRQGYLDDYSQQNGNVGIGTSISNEKLEIIGGTTSQELNVTGIATLTSVSGFIKKHTDYTGNIDFDAGDSGTLSGEIVVGTGLTMNVGTAATTSQGSVDSLKVYDMFQPPSGGTNQRPPAKPGAIFYNFDFKTIEFFDGNSWRQVDNTTTRGRAVLLGGSNPQTDIKFFQIMTLGNTENFGTLEVDHQYAAAFASNTRGVVAGGYSAPDSNYSQPRIEYITMASQGNGILFGSLGNSTFRNSGGASTSTRGLFFGGGYPSYYNVINYVEIGTLGDSLDFGDLTSSNMIKSCCASPTRAFCLGGYNPSNDLKLNHEINMITVSSKGNAIRFGDPVQQAYGMAGCSNNIRATFAGGYFSPNLSHSTKIQYFTMASEGNATVFGDLIIGSNNPAGNSNQVRAVFSGGYVTPGNINRIEFVTIATTGNAQDFGDLSSTDARSQGSSDSHGGLGGF